MTSALSRRSRGGHSRIRTPSRPRWTTGDNVEKVLDSAFQEFGLPKAMRSDHGPPLASTGAGRLSRLSVCWQTRHPVRADRARQAAAERPPRALDLFGRLPTLRRGQGSLVTVERNRGPAEWTRLFWITAGRVLAVDPARSRQELTAMFRTFYSCDDLIDVVDIDGDGAPREVVGERRTRRGPRWAGPAPRDGAAIRAGGSASSTRRRSGGSAAPPRR